MALSDFGKKLPLIGGLLGGGPKASIVGLDNPTKDLIHEGVQRSINESSGDISGQLQEGTAQAMDSLSGPDAGLTAAGTGQDENMLRAIQNKFRNESSKDLKKFRMQTDLQSKLLKSQRMQQMSQQAMMKQNVMTQNFAMLSQAYQQNEAARAEVISNIIGLGGTAAMMSGGGAKPRPMVNVTPPNFSSQEMASTSNGNMFGMSQGYGQF